MSKYWYLVAILIGMPCTMLMAARHELGWTILGVVSVACNLFNYTNSEKKEGE
jgi:hypothetical protein